MTGMPPHDWHAPILAAIAAAYSRSDPHVHYIEIGVDEGHTLSTVMPHVRSAAAVDVDLSRCLLHGRPGVYRNCFLHEMTSDQFFADYSGPEPKLIFIDGDHSSHQVAEDVAGALRIVHQDGTIAIHDTDPRTDRWAESHCGDGWRVRERMETGATERGYTTWTLPLFPGLTLVSRRCHAPAFR